MDIPPYSSGFYYTPGRFNASLTTSGHSLPCLQQPGKFYNICFRLADSQPQHVLETMQLELQAWQDTHRNEKYPALAKQRVRFASFEKCLHQNYGNCILANRNIQQIVSEIILRHNEKECQVGAFVIMSNHIHLLIKMLGYAVMKDLLQCIKRETTIAIRHLLDLNCGEIWMRGSFSRIVRSPRELEKTLQYIKNNPKGNLDFMVYERPDVMKFKR